jgi:archaellum component FlaF (FlaF/FlaG flagellin family)
MSVNPPPSPNVNRFNNLYWISADDGLTIGAGDLRYLKFPNAQGTEALLTTNVNGVLTSNSETIQADTTNVVSSRLKQNNLTLTLSAGYNKPSTAFTINCNNNVSVATQVFNMSALSITTGGQQFNFNSLLPPLSSQTIPAFDNSSNIMPTTAWVQGAISGVKTGFQEGLILQDKNYNYDAIVGIGAGSIFAGAYTGSCFAGSANNSVCGLTTTNGADVWLFLPVGTGGAPQIVFNSLAFAPDVLTFSADGKWGLLLGDGGGTNQTPVYRWDNNTFTITNAPLHYYSCACMSANGQYAIIGEISGAEKVRLSTNYGLDWVRVGPSGVFYDVCMSATGKYMFSMSQYSDGYISSDYGVTWTAVGIGGFGWYRCCMSANGQYIIALANDSGNPDRCYSSNDFGVTWVSMGANQIWDQTAMTDDGRFQVAWYNTGYYYSSNFGVSWTDATGSPNPRMSFNGRAKFSNQGKYITGNDGNNPNYYQFTEHW